MDRTSHKPFLGPLSLALPFLLGAVILVSASFGSASIGFRDSSGIILNRLFPFLNWNYPETMELIILQIRLPRIILALLVGTGLAAGGERGGNRVDHRDRGYESGEEKLGAVGARIERVSET